jgi:hypothetical protein
MGGGSWAMVCMALLAFVRGMAAEDVATTRDTLAYKDGDRVQGKVIEHANGIIVFKSDRFGELRVPEAEAVVIKAEAPVAAAQKTSGAPVPVAANGIKVTPPPATAAERADAERVSIWEKFSPSVLTARVRNFFGPWHGRLALSDEIFSQSTRQDTVTLDGHLQRKWERDDVQLNAHFDYALVNQVTTADIFKANGSWRHDFSRREFTQFRPSIEWNRASTLNGIANHYLLVQQEIGIGYSPVITPSRKLRLGVSENLFDAWNSAPPGEHTSHAVESAFDEIELTLPWRMTLSQRGVWYPIAHRTDSWEDRVELNKKLTETLSVSLRHEIRRHNPEASAPDYTRLKLLFGFDF